MYFHYIKQIRLSMFVFQQIMQTNEKIRCFRNSGFFVLRKAFFTCR